jgi:hypothetical protein
MRLHRSANGRVAIVCTVAAIIGLRTTHHPRLTIDESRNDESSPPTIAEKTQFASRGDTSSRHLPANSFVRSGALGTARFIEVNEVNHNLFGTKILGDLILTRGFVAENHHFGIT